jgi:hypothetical protein
VPNDKTVVSTFPAVGNCVIAGVDGWSQTKLTHCFMRVNVSDPDSVVAQSGGIRSEVDPVGP